MPHYTNKDMTYEEFSELLDERYEKGESTDDYSYSSSEPRSEKSNITTPYTFIIVDKVKEDNSFSDYSELIKKVKTIIENEGLTVVVKQIVVGE